MPASSAKIVLQGVSVRFESREGQVVNATDGVDLAVQNGEFVALVGPSGCGKSTLLNAVTGLVPYTGKVTIDGGPAADHARAIGYLFQENTLLPWRTARQNAAAGLEIRGMGKAEIEARVAPLMKRVGLEKFVDSYPHELSGGMKKRVALVQLLAFDPEIMLMDEPFGALDFQTRLRIEADVLKLVEETRKTVLFVTHDIDEAIELADRVVVMTGRPGKVKADYKVDMPRPRKLVENRGHPRFVELRDRIWDDLKAELIAQAA